MGFPLLPFLFQPCSFQQSTFYSSPVLSHVYGDFQLPQDSQWLPLFAPGFPISQVPGQRLVLEASPEHPSQKPNCDCTLGLPQVPTLRVSLGSL